MQHDVIIVGAGHNGLTAAAYLAMPNRLHAADENRAHQDDGDGSNGG